MSRQSPQLLIAAKARLAEIEREAAKLRDLVAFYEDRSSHRELRSSEGSHRTRSGPRSLSALWTAVLEIVAAHGEKGASYNEIIDAANDRGIDVSRNVLRSQMGNFAKRGFVESVATGVWRATGEGAKLFSPPESADRRQLPSEATRQDDTSKEAGALFSS
jgi:hypothetical protein